MHVPQVAGPFGQFWEQAENLGTAFSSWEPRLSCAMPLKNSAGSKKVGLKRKQRNILQGIQL